MNNEETQDILIPPYERSDKLEKHIYVVLEKTAKRYADSGLLDKAELFTNLRQARFVGVFRNNERKRDNKIVMGSARCIDDRMRAFVEGDFLIEVCSNSWRNLTDELREALLFHELCHCNVIEKDDKRNGGTKIVYSTKDHEFTGFYDELEFYGPWRDTLPSMDELE